MPSLLAAPNLLSFSRILVAPIIYALVVSGGRYGFVIAALLFVAASVTDTLDGEIARRRHLVSPLGIYLDTTSDKVLVTVLLVALAVARVAPGWMAAVIIAREFLVTGLRSYAAALGVVMLVLLEGDARQGGWLTGQSMPGSALLSPLGPYTLPVWSLLIAVVWTVGSGAEYIREAIPLLTRPTVTDALSRSENEP